MNAGREKDSAMKGDKHAGKEKHTPKANNKEVKNKLYENGKVENKN